MTVMSPNKEKLVQKIADIRQSVDKEGVPAKLVDSKLANRAAQLASKKSISFRCLICYSLPLVLAATYFGFDMYKMEDKCVIGRNLLFLEMSRPYVNCSFCANLTTTPEVDGDTFTREQFLSNYAYNGIPLLVKGGAKNWSALHTFSYDYLRELYIVTDDAILAVDEECQFFPYKTSFRSLVDVFDMTPERSRIDVGQEKWYVGWSNCHPDVQKELRKHYQRPAFLPEDSETSSIDWLFMGDFGGGAGVHIDYVQRPSWQAMIRGRKSWKIVPSPECDHICPSHNISMEPGDIILVDTNMWYHSTYIHPGEVSITIGSEYD